MNALAPLRRVAIMVMVVIVAIVSTGSVMAQKPGVQQNQQQSQSAYSAHRLQALNTTASAVGVTSDKSNLIVYGVIMDWNLGGDMVTSVALRNGDASLLVANGSGLQDGIKHTIVRDAVANLFTLVNDYVPSTSPNGDVTLPAPDGITFYLLTNKGRYVAKTTTVEVDSATSPLHELFSSMQFITGELRRASRTKK